MSNHGKVLVLLLFLVTTGTMGCRVGNLDAEKKDAQQKDGADDRSIQKAEAKSEQHEISDEPVYITAKEGTGRRVVRVRTAQGQVVQVTDDHDPWADRVVSFTMGKPAAKICTDPNTTTGKPDYLAKREKQTCLALGHRGELILEFVDNRLVDGPGDDLVVFEVGPVIEPVNVAISVDGRDWLSVGLLKGAKSTVDIGPYLPAHQRYSERTPIDRPLFRFVKITDAGAGRSNRSRKAGADIDAVGALNSVAAR